MGDSQTGNLTIGYCTNVHAGVTIDDVKAQFETHAVAVRDAVGVDVLPIGLWLAADASRSLVASGGVASFAAWLRERGLAAYTINGFPYAQFHDQVVKTSVYEPAWDDDKRLAYTKDVVTVLAGLTEHGGSVSTLPIGWRAHFDGERHLAALHNLHAIAEHCRATEDATGKRISIDIEPEPGCVLDRAEHVGLLFDQAFSGEFAWMRRYIGVCHDVCHAAVMREDQAAVIASYIDRGIRIGKVQVSSAVSHVVRSRDDLEALRTLAEPVYQHQTTVCDRTTETTTYFDDLPDAIAAYESGEAEYRVHFHVPVFAERVGELGTTRDAIAECLTAIQSCDELPAIEIETYAWGVLPESVQPARLADGIAQEIKWLHAAMGDQT